MSDTNGSLLFADKIKNMKAEAIMQSNLLDIIFENRNKEYGAYPLRKYYSNRLYQAIAFTLALAALFSILMKWNSSNRITCIYPKVTDVITLTKPPVDKVIKPVEKVIKPIVKAASGSQRPPVQEVQSTIPIITRDTTAVTTMPTIDDIDKAKIGLSNIKGVQDAGTIINKKIDDSGTGGKGDGKAMDDDDILEGAIVERMPEFPGGKDALVKYLLRNINQPNDLELSDKLVVIAEFVVNKQGEIDNIKITQHARKDIEDNVVKVISKMPRWKPGFQNGKNVSVYYSLPITFISNDTN